MSLYINFVYLCCFNDILLFYDRIVGVNLEVTLCIILCFAVCLYTWRQPPICVDESLCINNTLRRWCPSRNSNPRKFSNRLSAGTLFATYLLHCLGSVEGHCLKICWAVDHQMVKMLNEKGKHVVLGYGKICDLVIGHSEVMMRKLIHNNT